MKNPRKDVYAWLTAAGFNVAKQGQNVFNDLPTITYYIASQAHELTLDNEIGNARIAVQIDIWSEEAGSDMLEQIEAIFRTHNYTLTFSADVPNIDSDLNHISARFETTA